MLEFKEKNKRRRILYSRPVLFLLILGVGFALHNVFGVYSKYTDATKKYKESQEELSVLEAKNKQLAESIDRMKTERGVEEEIREKFMVSKEGEGVIFLVDGEDASRVERESVKTHEGLSWWRELFGLFSRN